MFKTQTLKALSKGVAITIKMPRPDYYWIRVQFPDGYKFGDTSFWHPVEDIDTLSTRIENAIISFGA